MGDDIQVCYHVWFGTKRRKWLLLGDIQAGVKALLWDIAREKGIRLKACETMVDHVHLLLDVAPAELPKAIHLLKGISARRVFETFPELKMDARTENLWQKSYGAKQVADGAKRVVAEYIRSQESRPEKFDRPRRANSNSSA